MQSQTDETLSYPRRKQDRRAAEECHVLNTQFVEFSARSRRTLLRNSAGGQPVSLLKSCRSRLGERFTVLDKERNESSSDIR